MAIRRNSRLDKRREADATPRDRAADPKKRAAKKSSRRKAKAVGPKRLAWGIFSGTLKEEARFPYEQRAAADEKLEQLRAKGKKLYFIQPIKEVITDGIARPRPLLDEDEFDVVQTEDANWTEAQNVRRIELLVLRTGRRLDDSEALELEELQEKCAAFLDAESPLPFDKLSMIEDKLEKKARRNDAP